MVGKSREFVSFNLGVPQVTVLGLLLFSIMINDITAVRPERNLLIKYADDKPLSFPIKTTLPNSSVIQEVQNVQQWGIENRMELNLSKTWEMQKQVPDSLPSIGRKHELMLLGVTFNQDPSNWGTQIDLLLHKATIAPGYIS